jgi:hypothetical protein
MSENAAGVGSGSDHAGGVEFGLAVVGYRAFNEQMAWFPCRAPLSMQVSVLDDADKLRGVALSISFGRTGESCLPTAVIALGGIQLPGQQDQGSEQHDSYRFPHMHTSIG